MVRIIEVTESTTDPDVLENRWLEITRMLSQETDGPYTDNAEVLDLRPRANGNHATEREDLAERCLAGC